MKGTAKMTWEEYKDTWLSHNTCNFCQGSHMHTCTSYSCSPAYRKAEKYLDKVVARDEVASGKRKFVTELSPCLTEGSPYRDMVSGAWAIRDSQSWELVIRFRDSVPGMQQSVCLPLIAKELLSDAVKARAWHPEDEEVIRIGIPCGGYAVKTDAAG